MINTIDHFSKKHTLVFMTFKSWEIVFLHLKHPYEKNKTARFNGLLEHLKAKNAPVEVTNRFFVMGGGDFFCLYF